MERTESTERERTNPSPEVLEKPVRRRCTMEYKVGIVAEADACTETGQLGELLRREGLYSSHLSTWRRQRDEGVLAGLTFERSTGRCSIDVAVDNGVTGKRRESRSFARRDEVVGANSRHHGYRC